MKLKERKIYRECQQSPSIPRGGLRVQQGSTAAPCRLLHHTHLGSQTEVMALLRKRLYQHLGGVPEMWAKTSF